MTDLYELTRKFVRRGCPDHPDVYLVEGGDWFVHSDPLNENLARDLWTMHALQWAHDLGLMLLSREGTAVLVSTKDVALADTTRLELKTELVGKGASILEAIEAATRYLERA